MKEEAERDVVPENNYCLLNEEGKPAPVCEMHVPGDNIMWHEALRLAAFYMAAYSITADGRAYVAYDCGRYDKREIYLASFTERDLKAGKIVDKGSFLHRLAVKGGVQ